MGLLLLLFAPAGGEAVVALLCAVVVACCFSLCSASAVRLPVALAFVAAAFALPVFLAFLPLVAYVLQGERHVAVRFAWLVPLVASLRFGAHALTAAAALLCVAAVLMARRAARTASAGERHRRLRDEQREVALALAQKNRDLLAAQDYEVRLATLSERGRIAREIHDNVGHLLTRSIMQVEALQVVHAADGRVCGELRAVGETLHEAMDTVRKSVHDLHDDAFDLRVQLQRAIDGCGMPHVRLSYDAGDVPAPVAYGMLAVAREALSNVARHSDASRVEVSVVEYPALYQLVVQDNGTPACVPPSLVGADGVLLLADVAADGGLRAAPGLQTGAGGMGLRTMEERIGALGGRLRVEYRKGFRVFASIPKEGGGEGASISKECGGGEGARGSNGRDAAASACGSKERSTAAGDCAPDAVDAADAARADALDAVGGG